MTTVAVGELHTLALAEDGLVYAWGKKRVCAVLGNQNIERGLLPKPVEGLRGVRVSGIAACSVRGGGRGRGVGVGN